MNKCYKCLHYHVCTKWRKPALYGITIYGGCDNQFKAKTDYAEVVRCKECKFFHDKGYCTKITGLTRIKPDDFCSYGERKDNG